MVAEVDLGTVVVAEADLGTVVVAEADLGTVEVEVVEALAGSNVT